MRCMSRRRRCVLRVPKLSLVGPSSFAGRVCLFPQLELKHSLDAAEVCLHLGHSGYSGRGCEYPVSTKVLRTFGYSRRGA
jgi:hypothetical protein